MSALFDLGSKVNAIYPTFTKQLSLFIRPTDIGVQKNDSPTLDTLKMVVTTFSITDKVNWVIFFEETFLVANVSLKVVLGMLFFTLNSANIDFLDRKLQWRTYINKVAFLTTRRVKLVDNKKFAAAALDPENEIFVVYVASLSLIALSSSSPLELDVHPFHRPQISGLIAEKAPTAVSTKYSDFVDVFIPNLTSKLPEHTRINYYAIKLVNGQQPTYGPIYNLKLVELETLKAFIETNLANKLIRPSKSFAGTFILFDQKSNDFLWLCVNYWGFNNLTIKNRYPLLLIEELLDRLGRAKRFPWLDLTNAYHRMRICEGDE